MASRRAVLLTPSKSSLPIPLLSDKEVAPESPLFAILTKSAHLHHSRLFSCLLFSYSYALFCTHQDFNSFLFKRFRTLCAKQGVWANPGPPFLKKYFNSHAATLTRSDSPKVA